MSETEQPTEDQNETAGDGAAKSELPVGDLNAGVGTEQPGGIPSDADDGSAKPTADETSPPDDDEALDVDPAESTGVDMAPEGTPYLSDDGLPLWKCHKTVAAFKIAEIQNIGNGNVQLIGENDCVFVCDAAYVDKHRPQVGGYFVRYHDGYRSWSPAEAFEDGYDLIEA